MKKTLLLLTFCLSALIASAQEFYVSSAGTAADGSYLVSVKVSAKKKEFTSAQDMVMRYAVDGVMFNGLTNAQGQTSQKPLIKDPDVRVTKPEFFQAFYNEKAYTRYCSIVPSSLVSMKNKQTKKIETTATVVVNKEQLQHYLEESGIIKGFSTLW
jgi:uncharacterized protein YxeA